MTLQIKIIRENEYLYWKTGDGRLLSLGKRSEVLALVDRRIAKKSRDKDTLIFVMEIQDRKNMVEFLSLSPGEIKNEVTSLE